MTKHSSKLWPLLPAAVALVAFANTLPGDFVYDDVVLIEKGAELRDFDPHRIFLSNYWGAEHADRNYRPLTLLSYALNFQASEKAWPFHAVNVVLNAAVAVLVYLVLRELLRDAPLAALGASLYAVLPIHTEAVANIVGRAELLAGLAIFGAWLLALRGGERGRLGSVVAAGVVTFGGLLAKESVITVIPLIVISSLVLKRRVPWRMVTAASLAAVAYIVLRAVVLSGKREVESLVDNPLYGVDALTRAVNAVKLLGLYAVKTVAPLNLSADYSYNQIPAAPLDEPMLWAGVIAFAAPLAVVAWLLRRRAPLVTLALAFFVVAFAVTSNVLFPIGTIFAERLAYAPSFVYPLLVTVVVAVPAVRRRKVIVVPLLCVLFSVCGLTWARNRDWSDRVTMYLRMPMDAPLSAQSHLKAAEAYTELWNRAKAPEEDNDFLDRAEAAAKRSMEIYSESGKGEAKLAEVLYHKGRFADAAAHLDHSIPALIEHRQIEPIEYRLRGECFLQLNRPADAYKDFEVYIQLLAGLHARPDPAGYNFRGLSRAFLGKLDEALADFNRALELERDWAEIWNNRGMCKLHMRDLGGAIDDWRKGLELCRSAGVLYHPTKDSAFSFLEKISAAYQTIANTQRAAGNEDAARSADAEAVKAKAAAAQSKVGAAAAGR